MSHSTKSCEDCKINSGVSILVATAGDSMLVKVVVVDSWTTEWGSVYRNSIPREISHFTIKWINESDWIAHLRNLVYFTQTSDGLKSHLQFPVTFIHFWVTSDRSGPMPEPEPLVKTMGSKHKSSGKKLSQPIEVSDVSSRSPTQVNLQHSLLPSIGWTNLNYQNDRPRHPSPTCPSLCVYVVTSAKEKGKNAIERKEEISRSFLNIL